MNDLQKIATFKNAGNAHFAIHSLEENKIEAYLREIEKGADLEFDVLVLQDVGKAKKILANLKLDDTPAPKESEGYIDYLEKHQSCFSEMFIQENENALKEDIKFSDKTSDGMVSYLSMGLFLLCTVIFLLQSFFDSRSKYETAFHLLGAFAFFCLGLKKIKDYRKQFGNK